MPCLDGFNSSKRLTGCPSPGRNDLDEGLARSNPMPAWLPVAPLILPFFASLPSPSVISETFVSRGEYGGQ